MNLALDLQGPMRNRIDTTIVYIFMCITIGSKLTNGILSQNPLQLIACQNLYNLED